MYYLSKLTRDICIFNDFSPNLRDSSYKFCFRLWHNYLYECKCIHIIYSLMDNSLSLGSKYSVDIMFLTFWDYGYLDCITLTLECQSEA